MALTTMYPAKNNSPITSLTNALNSSDTTMTVADASVLPSAPNLAVIGSADNAEIVLYTAINGSNVTIVRGQNGTTPGTWVADTPVARNFTAMDHEAFRENILDLDNRKIEGVSWGDVTGDLTDQTDLQTALDAKQGTLTFDSVPVSGSTNPVTSGGLYSAFEKEIMYFNNQAVSAATNALIMEISDARIDTNTVVLNCVFNDPTKITTSVSWSSETAGKMRFTGTCTGATTARVVLGQKGN